MKMKIFGTLLLLVVLLTDPCEGLELDLDLDAQAQMGSGAQMGSRAQVGSGAACGVLTCVEDSQANEASTASRNISKLTIFKTSGAATPNAQSSDPLGVEVASVSPDRPHVAQESDGVKANGVLLQTSGGQQRASLTLEMTRSSDCLSDFSCQLLSVDAAGAESVSVARVRQSRRRRSRRSQDDSEAPESPVAMETLHLVHQVDLKVTTASKATENLVGNVKNIEQKMETFENRWVPREDKMSSIESNMETLNNKMNIKMGLVEKAASQLESKVASLENRLEDKMASSERALQTTLASLQNRIESKMEVGIEDKVGDVSIKLVEFTKDVKSLVEDIKNTVNKSLTNAIQHMHREGKEALSNLSSATQHMVESLTLVAEDIAESGANVSQSVTNDFSLLGQELRGSFHQLVEDVNTSANDTLSSATTLLLQSNTTVIAAMNEVLAPKRCSKGMITVVSSAPYPYPLIQPREGGIVDVPYLCDMATDKGGWIIIQRRVTGDVDFYRGWNEYKHGFGDLKGDFYLGNENIYRITSRGLWELRVDMVYEGISYYARFKRFSVADEGNQYRLSVRDYTGTAGDSLTYFSGEAFSTYDRDNDVYRGSCAKICQGGWWYQGCTNSNLNGRWGRSGNEGTFWYEISKRTPLSYTEMKIREISTS